MDENLIEYRARLVSAINTLQNMHNTVPRGPGRDGDMDQFFEKKRLAGKIDGVKLALSYLDEMER